MHVASHPKSYIEELVKRLWENGTPLPGVCLISDPDLANRLADYTRVMFRQVWDQYERYNANTFFRGLDPNSDHGRERARQLGREFFFGAHWPYTKRLRKDKVIPVKLRNETGFHPLDCWFDLGTMQAADEAGYKVAICGDSVGTPEIWQFAQRTPALRYAMKNKHYVTLNQYGRDKPPDSDVSDPIAIEWFGLRHRQFYAAVPEDCRPQIIIGETGSYDSTVFRGKERTLNDMARYDALLKDDPYIEWACWWTAAEWSGYPLSSLDSMLPEYETYIHTGQVA